MQIKNPFLSVSKDSGGQYVTGKADKENHGYGLKNVEDVVSRYGGKVDIRSERNIFEVAVFLPM